LGEARGSCRVAPKAALALAFGALAIAGAGCGGDEGVEDGATVTVYAVPPQCVGARRDLENFHGKAGRLRVRLVCLKAAERAGRLDLATVGANARRAIEDSGSVAYLEAPGRGTRFSQPILEEARIALISTHSGATSMGRVLDDLAHWDPGESPRESVWGGR
jgi:hypothetical protein